MRKKFNQVYQFKVTLMNTRPPVWRRIQVPGNFTFWDLHVAIQDSMGWLDYHLHEFKLIDPASGWNKSIGIPEEDDMYGKDMLPGWKQKMSAWFTPANPKAKYIYDFGDDWIHELLLEKIIPCREGVTYPVCLAGKMACPPEDCGGTWGYGDICKGKSEFQSEFKDYAPAYFDPKKVVFEDSKKRFKIAFGRGL
jgi:hypothetical protein